MVKIKKKQSYGFSLIELLVAMVVGLIIISGVFSLHLGSRKTQKVSEMQLDMVADARFAIELIAYDLRHAGMWGGTNDGQLINCRSGDVACVVSGQGETLPTDSGVPINNDCASTGNPTWAYNTLRPVFATNNGNPYSGTCIHNINEGYMPNTDVLEIHYADSNVPGDLVEKQAYIRSNIIDGRMFIGEVQPELDAYDTSGLTANHELYAYAYYISDFTDKKGDGIPSLRRAALINGPEVQNQVLISGVVDMQVQFGEDVDEDGIVDRYVNPDFVDDWNEIYAAKIWLVIQSEKPQKGIDTSKTFSIAGEDEPFGGVNGSRFFMVSSVIYLRNLRNLF